MPFIVLDLEWNQAMSSKSSVYNHLPIHLRGEIIQIGAVKLDENQRPCDEFSIYVRPQWFRKMHFKVKKITGIDEAMLDDAPGFPEALEMFLDWAGPDCQYMTWGYDDSGIMEENCIIHDLDIDWMGQWINLQLIFNKQTDGDKNQKSLDTAMEHFGIEQTRVAHDALADAYNTGLVCSHLNLEEGLSEYDRLLHHLSSKKAASNSDDNTEPLEHVLSDAYPTRQSLWNADFASAPPCPVCKQALRKGKWVNQGDKRYMNLMRCDTDGAFLVRLRIRHEEDDTWHANRLIYKADDSVEKYFKTRSYKLRRKKHGKPVDSKNKHT